MRRPLRLRSGLDRFGRSRRSHSDLNKGEMPMTWTVAVCVVCLLVTRQVVLARVERSEQQKKDERLQWSRWMWHKLERTLKELDLAAVWGPNFSILVPEAQIH